jgi:hypothetical protein
LPPTTGVTIHPANVYADHSSEGELDITEMSFLASTVILTVGGATSSNRKPSRRFSFKIAHWRKRQAGEPLRQHGTNLSK